jgi:hypothetical protein
MNRPDVRPKEKNPPPIEYLQPEDKRFNSYYRGHVYPREGVGDDGERGTHVFYEEKIGGKKLLWRDPPPEMKNLQKRYVRQRVQGEQKYDRDGKIIRYPSAENCLDNPLAHNYGRAGDGAGSR